MKPARFFVAAGLLAGALTASSAALAGPGGPPTRAAQQTTYLAQVLRVGARQLPALRTVVGRRWAATDSLDQQRFASPAAASAAYSVVEYRFYRGLTGVLTPAQFETFVRLPEPTVAPGSLARR